MTEDDFFEAKEAFDRKSSFESSKEKEQAEFKVLQSSFAVLAYRYDFNDQE